MTASKKLIALCLLVGLPDVTLAAESVETSRQRQEMVRIVQAEAFATRGETGIAEISPKVLQAMARVPRHAFLPRALQPYAYLPTPLPVTEEQNLAAPFLVALMTHLADVNPNDRVLETGTGAGYHAAVLAEIGAEVYSVEVLAPLATRATALLKELGYSNVRVRAGDGYYGWQDAAPFDAIIVKEAVNHVPTPLLQQLKPGGRLVLPLGPSSDNQVLTLIEKAAEGRLRKQSILPVRFSPLQGGERL